MSRFRRRYYWLLFGTLRLLFWIQFWCFSLFWSLLVWVFPIFRFLTIWYLLIVGTIFVTLMSITLLSLILFLENVLLLYRLEWWSIWFISILQFGQPILVTYPFINFVHLLSFCVRHLLIKIHFWIMAQYPFTSLIPLLLASFLHLRWWIRLVSSLFNSSFLTRHTPKVKLFAADFWEFMRWVFIIRERMTMPSMSMLSWRW